MLKWIRRNTGKIKERGCIRDGDGLQSVGRQAGRQAGRITALISEKLCICKAKSHSRDMIFHAPWVAFPYFRSVRSSL